MTIGVLLAGCGVYDGSEIHEAVFTLLAIEELGYTALCMAPDKPQHHVIDHTTGNELPENRNVLTESARIARGQIQSLSTVDVDALDALVIPGGFGAAKNLNQWALKGPEGEIEPEVAALIQKMHAQGKPIAALCMGPTVLASALAKNKISAHLSVGSAKEASPYDIAGISAGMQSLGHTTEDKSIREVLVDSANKLVSAPCYMMEASISEVRNNAKQAIEALDQLLKG
jgi:enhancing lycopene biosynthesis protein 2